MDRHYLGRMGEDIAAQILESKGYHILERNFRCRFGEIDIIAEVGGAVVFIEVKARATKGYGRPIEAVTNRKLANMKRSAMCYTSFHNLDNIEYRFDIVEIYCNPYTNKVVHWEGVV